MQILRSTRVGWGCALAALAALALSLSEQTLAQPTDLHTFVGNAITAGRYSNLRKTAAELSISRQGDVLTVTRTGRYTSPAHRHKPHFTWTSSETTLKDEVLEVTYRIAVDGTSLNLTESGGFVAAINGETQPTDANGNAFSADQVNVFRATYRFDDQGAFREEVKNTTRKAPEEWWRKIGTKGANFSGARLKLGHGKQRVLEGRGYPVVLPMDGTLTLSASAGTIELRDPKGQVAGVVSGTILTLELGHEDPQLGIYTAKLRGGGPEATLQADFVQDGRIDSRIRPWSSHTYYPIYEENSGSKNSNTLYVADGPLEKFDTALSLTGKQSSVWWEKGGDYRTSTGFEHGHYTQVSSPKESNAEEHWKADLNGDGLIETGDVAPVLSRYDANADGEISRVEAQDVFRAGALRVLFANYDGDQSGVIDTTEISAGFVARYDTNGSASIDATEWATALRADFPQVIEGNARAGLVAFMGRDANDDGVVSGDEIGRPGSMDFMDSDDVDGDFQNYFDRNNVKLVTTAGVTHFGNKLEENGSSVKLFKGRKSDELVVELDASDIKERATGIADGDTHDSYSVSWWGHCNAWAMASIVFRKPEGELTVNGVTFSVRDQKGVLVEYGMGNTEDSAFYWQQWGGDEIHRWLRVEQQGMMADMDLKDPHNSLGFQVWNYPLLGYRATLKEAEGGDPYVVDVRCTLEKGSYSDEDSSSTATLGYRLHLADDGTIRDGDESKTSWEQTNSSGKREYVRYLIHPYRFVDTTSGSRNPNVSLSRLEELFGSKLKYNRLEDLAAEDTQAGGLAGGPVVTAD
jgi:hypothetical protein